MKSKKKQHDFPFLASSIIFFYLSNQFFTDFFSSFSHYKLNIRMFHHTHTEYTVTTGCERERKREKQRKQ